MIKIIQVNKPSSLHPSSHPFLVKRIALSTWLTSLSSGLLFNSTQELKPAKSALILAALNCEMINIINKKSPGKAFCFIQKTLLQNKKFIEKTSIISAVFHLSASKKYNLQILICYKLVYPKIYALGNIPDQFQR